VIAMLNLENTGKFDLFIMKNRHPRKILLLVAWLMVALVIALFGPTHAQDEGGTVYIAEVRGVISPPVANYLIRVLDEAEVENASLVVIQLDTPGGLDTSMREIIQAILDSPVPVATYVTPTGARAASAGLFILMSSHIAAMTPSTNTGAAHPVGLGGEADETMTAKIENDAAAYIRSLAVLRERNASWAEQAVRESVSVTDQEALELNVIDLVASNLDGLLEQIDGQTFETAVGTVTLDVISAPRHEASMTFPERFLHVILDPNLAFILLSIGSIGIIAELYNPGALVPGIAGVISLILAFFALGNLPTNWAGVGLIVLALILFIAELNTDTTGVLAVGGIVAFLLGAFILFRPFQTGSPALPEVEVSPWLIAMTTASMAAFTLFVVGQMIRTRHAPLLTGYEQFVGQLGQVRRDLAPEGRVWFQGQLWFARTQSGQEVETGKDVRIVSVDDLTLIVEPLDEETTSDNDM
jgi:membrane-bound serine protease (ClpP class)